MQNWPLKKSGLEQKRALYLKRGSIATNVPYIKQALYPYFYECFSINLSHFVLSATLSSIPHNNRRTL